MYRDADIKECIFSTVDLLYSHYALAAKIKVNSLPRGRFFEKAERTGIGESNPALDAVFMFFYSFLVVIINTFCTNY